MRLPVNAVAPNCKLRARPCGLGLIAGLTVALAAAGCLHPAPPRPAVASQAGDAQPVDGAAAEGRQAGGASGEGRQAAGGLQSAGSRAAEIARCLRDVNCSQRFVAAHRGGNGGPECSREAIRKSLEWGVPIVEIDLRLSADGILYVLHDATLDRTTTLHGALKQTASQDLQRARLSNGEPLPRFEDLYLLVDHRAVFDLHFLDEDAIGLAGGWLAEHGNFDDTIFFVAGAGQAAAAARVRRAHPRLIVMLRADNRDQFDAGAGILGAVPEITHVGYFARRSFISYIHARGSRVWANALGWERLFEPLRSLVLHANLAGADVVQTDDPKRFLRTEP
jgi:glycerophosphoryl diester phosphodiesterase